MTKPLSLALSCVVFLSACGGGGGSGDGGGPLCPTNNPAPRINGSPPTVATVGRHYSYFADAEYSCLGFLFIPGLCFGIEAVQIPPGAQVDRGAVSWAPSASNANTNVSFSIQTPPDLCGGRARQSWVVSVHPMPTIESFTASKSTVAPGETVTLTAVFQGNGAIEGLGTVTSGVPITTAPLLSDQSFRLSVFNNAGTQVSQFVSVEVLSPPVITSFTATPSTIGTGSSTTLTWNSNGDISQVRVTPPGMDVPRASSLVVTPSVTTTYILTASNQLTSVDSSVEVTVLPAPNIRSFGATPASSVPGGTVTLSADFDGTNGRIEHEINGIYTTLAPVNPGDAIVSGPLYRSTRYRLSVQNSVGMVVTRDLHVTLTGPGTFQPTSGQPVTPTRSYHTATLLLDGRVFIAGDRSHGVTTEIFNPVSQTFTSGPNMLIGRSRHQAVLLLDGRVFIVGGCFFADPCNQTEMFDPVSGTLTAGPSLPGDAEGAVRLPDGRVLIVVALSQLSGAVIFNSVDGTVGPFIEFSNSFWGVVNKTRVLAPLSDGRLFLFSTNPLHAEIFTPGPDSFSIAGAPNAARVSGIAASALLDGRVLLTGGAVPPDTLAEAYSPQADRFDALGSQQVASGFGAYGNQTSTPLADGRVLLVGGNGSPLAETFDPTINTFAVTGGLRTGRGYSDSFITTFTSTLLDDGRVLVVGGCAGQPCEAEIYTP